MYVGWGGVGVICFLSTLIYNSLMCPINFFQDILKYTERAGLDTTALRKAYNVMLVVPKDANDMMQFGRLQGYDVSTLHTFKLNLVEHSQAQLVEH